MDDERDNMPLPGEYSDGNSDSEGNSDSDDDEVKCLFPAGFLA